MDALYPPETYHVSRSTLSQQKVQDLQRVYKIGQRFIKDRTTHGAALALGFKVAGSGLAILMFGLAARLMGAEKFGQFAILFNIVSFLAVAACLGQETLIVRSWSEYSATRAFGFAHGAFRFGWMVIGVSAVTVSTLLWLSGSAGWLKAESWSLLAAAVFLAAQTLLHFSSHSSRLIAGFVASETYREIIWRLLVIIAMALVAGWGFEVSAPLFFSVAAFGMLGGVIIQSFKVRASFPRDVSLSRPEYAAHHWLPRAAVMWFSACLEAASQYADVILIGFLVTPAQAGGYFVAMRIANVFSMISSGMINYTSPRIGTMYFSGDVSGLQTLLKKLMAITLILVAAILVALVIFGHTILNLLGAAFTSEYSTLLILAFSVSAVTLAGPVSAVLQTTGHELLYSRALVLSMAARLVLFLVFVTLYGSLGAAIAWGLSTVPLGLALAWMCRKKIGIDPSIFALIHR